MNKLLNKMKIWGGVTILILGLLPAAFAQDSTDGNPGEVKTPVLSLATSELIKVADSGVDQEALLVAVKREPRSFDLNADDVIYLRDVGIPNDVIDAMLDHDRSVRETASAPVQSAPPVRQVVREPVPTYVEEPPTEVRYFYDSLSPYGTWINIHGQGWAWQPNVVVINSSWRPYYDSGQWIWTDHGWYWASDYSWGWAPFHYGRWAYVRHAGWVWFPDRVWAPAWVAWRSHDSYCGWAPLPPRSSVLSVGVSFDFGLSEDSFVFISFGNFRDRNVSRHSLPRTRVHEVFNQTTVINNYTINSNNTVINNGIGTESVAAATGAPVQALKVVEQPALASAGVTANRVVKNGSIVAMVRTPVPTRAKTGKIAVQNVSTDQAVVPQVPTAVATQAATTSKKGRVERRATRTTTGKTSAPTDVQSTATSPTEAVVPTTDVKSSATTTTQGKKKSTETKSGTSIAQPTTATRTEDRIRTETPKVSPSAPTTEKSIEPVVPVREQRASSASKPSPTDEEKTDKKEKKKESEVQSQIRTAPTRSEDRVRTETSRNTILTPTRKSSEQVTQSSENIKAAPVEGRKELDERREKVIQNQPAATPRSEDRARYESPKRSITPPVQPREEVSSRNENRARVETPREAPRVVPTPRENRVEEERSAPTVSRNYSNRNPVSERTPPPIPPSADRSPRAEVVSPRREPTPAPAPAIVQPTAPATESSITPHEKRDRDDKDKKKS